eukprot:jgi/Tetstr1/420360/TSEL_011480.t1
MARSASPSWAWLLVSLVVLSPCVLVSVLAVDKFELVWNELLDSRRALPSSAELFKSITAALALCTIVALRINKRGKKLHVEHEYGAEVAKEFDAVDPLGEKGSADNKELKKALEKVKAKKPSSSSSRAKPSSSSRKPESFRRGSDNRRESGRREEKPPSGRSSAADITCYRCQRKGHFSRDCPSARR